MNLPLCLSICPSIYLPINISVSLFTCFIRFTLRKLIWTILILRYASRVKLITNDAQKNQDNKEIARLKSVIAKLKAGESVAEEEEAS